MHPDPWLERWPLGILRAAAEAATRPELCELIRAGAADLLLGRVLVQGRFAAYARLDNRESLADDESISALIAVKQILARVMLAEGKEDAGEVAAMQAVLRPALILEIAVAALTRRNSMYVPSREPVLLQSVCLGSLVLRWDELHASPAGTALPRRTRGMLITLARASSEAAALEHASLARALVQSCMSGEAPPPSLVSDAQACARIDQKNDILMWKMRVCAECRREESDETGRLLRCGCCGVTLYCSKACQRGHHRLHKRFCKKD